MTSIDQVFETLLEALREAQVPHAFIGALGAIAWGRPRATTDLDLVAVCQEPSFLRLRGILLERGFTESKGVGPATPSDHLPDIAIFWAGSSPQIRIDLFLAKVAFEREAVETSRPAVIFGREVQVACPEAMIVYKLLASRPKDLIDVETIIQTRAQAGDELDWGLIERWSVEWGIEATVAEWKAKSTLAPESN